MFYENFQKQDIFYYLIINYCAKIAHILAATLHTFLALCLHQELRNTLSLSLSLSLSVSRKRSAQQKR